MSTVSGTYSGRRCGSTWTERAGAAVRQIRTGLWRALPAIVIVLLGLALWEALVRLDLVSGLFFPAPTHIAETFGKLTAKGILQENLYETLFRLLGGFLIGAIPGVALGLLMGFWDRLRWAADPIIAALHPAPKMALLPIIMIFLGLGEAPKLAVVALGAFFPMLVNTMAGVRQISPIHFEVASNCGAGRVKTFFHVALPGSLPFILAGVRVGFNSAMHIVVAVELLTAQVGLGAMIWYAWETMRVEELYVAVAVTAALGVLFNVILRRVTPVLVPWQGERST